MQHIQQYFLVPSIANGIETVHSYLTTGVHLCVELVLTVSRCFLINNLTVCCEKQITKTTQKEYQIQEHILTPKHVANLEREKYSRNVLLHITNTYNGNKVIKLKYIIQNMCGKILIGMPVSWQVFFITGP